MGQTVIRLGFCCCCGESCNTGILFHNIGAWGIWLFLCFYASLVKVTSRDLVNAPVNLVISKSDGGNRFLVHLLSYTHPYGKVRQFGLLSIGYMLVPLPNFRSILSGAITKFLLMTSSGMPPEGPVTARNPHEILMPSTNSSKSPFPPPHRNWDWKLGLLSSFIHLLFSPETNERGFQKLIKST